MKNILIGKIGQKIIFDRESKESKRSNVNGNYGTQKLIKLLAENNPEINFYLISDNDLNKNNKENIPSNLHEYKFEANLKYDNLIVLAGIVDGYFNRLNTINLINKFGENINYILLADDPRCLRNTLESSLIKVKPKYILSQFEGSIDVNNVSYDVNYCPIQTAICYKEKINECKNKDEKFIVIANTSGKEYDRPVIVGNLLHNMKNVSVFGRLTSRDKKEIGDQTFKGEINYEDMINVYKKTESTLVVPIEKGWVTTKYLESLLNGCLPLIHKDYGVKYLLSDNIIVINDKNDLNAILKYMSEDRELSENMCNILSDELVKPYIDGKKLNSEIMKYITYDEELHDDILSNITIRSNDIDKAFLQWIDILKENKINQDSRDGDVVGEVINATTVIEDPTKCIMKNDVRNMPMRYAIGELLWYLSGNNNLKEIQKYTSNWDRMSDDGKTVNSNYGYCIQYKYGFDQWEYVLNMLKDNPNSRQAIIHIKTANNESSKDVNCTVCCQFFIRNNKLYMTTYMRSNDVWYGFPYDIFQFTSMQILMSMQLGIELGTYTHIAGSLHLYKRDYDKLSK